MNKSISKTVPAFIMAGSGGTKACRLCLVMDSELISIDMQLENSMRSILGQNITYQSGLPKYACNDCAEFLRLFKDFRAKCLIAQTVLYQILKSAGQITDVEIKKLNRKRLKLDTQITLPQKEVPKEIPPTQEILLKEIPLADLQSESASVKIEPENSDTEAMVESESDREDKSNVVFEDFEESEGSLEARIPLEEGTVTKKVVKEEFVLPLEHADLSEGFKISIPPINVPKVEIDESSVAAYHCERCCRASAGLPERGEAGPADCPHGSGYCPFEFPTLAEYCTHATDHRTYSCRKCSFSANDVATARHHRQKEHSNKVYSCCYCNHRTTDPTAFARHVRGRHPVQLVCACGRSFDSPRGRRAHAARAHGGHPGTRDSTQTRLKRKGKKTTKRKVNADSKLLCRKCGIQFSTSAARRRHVDDGHVVYLDDEAISIQRKPTASYDPQILEKACEAVRSEGMGIREASRLFKIPKTTLQNRLKHEVPRGKRGPPPIFNEKEEGILVDFIKSAGRAKAKAVMDRAAILAKQCNRENFFNKGRPGVKWYLHFMNRHPELKQYAKTKTC